MLALAPPAGESLRRRSLRCSSTTPARRATPASASRASASASRGSAASAPTPRAIASSPRFARKASTSSGSSAIAQRPTGLMLKEPGAGVRYYRAGIGGERHGTRRCSMRVPVADARAVLVTGVTALIGADAHAAGLALLDRARGLRIVDPNLRPGSGDPTAAPTLVRPFVERCDLLLCGRRASSPRFWGQDEADRRRGAGRRESTHRRSARAAAAALGPREVVVRGAGDDRRARRRRRGASSRSGATPPSIRSAPATPSMPATSPSGCAAAPSTSALRAGVRCGAAVTTALSDTAAFPRSLSRRKGHQGHDEDTPESLTSVSTVSFVTANRRLTSARRVDAGISACPVSPSPASNSCSRPPVGGCAAHAS